MRPPKPLCWVVLVATLPQVVGCYSFRTTADPRPGVYSEIRLTKRNGEEIKLVQAMVGSLEIVGRDPSGLERVQVAKSEIESIEVGRLDVVRTLALVSLIGLGVTGIVFGFMFYDMSQSGF